MLIIWGLEVLENRVTVYFSNKDGCTCIALFFLLVSVLHYSFLVALLHHHQAHPVWNNVNIELVLFQESINKITPFLGPCVIQGHVPA